MGPECRLGDSDLERVRNILWTLAELAVDMFLEDQPRGGADGGKGRDLLPGVDEGTGSEF